MRLAAGDVVRLWMDRPQSARRRFRRGRRSARCESCSKTTRSSSSTSPPAFSGPARAERRRRSVYDQIEDHLRPRGKRRPLVVHRLDRDTSGLVVFAKERGRTQRLKGQFRRREPERVYWAIVYGHPSPPAGDVAGSPGVGPEGADSEGDASPRPERRGRHQRLSRNRVASRDDVADRGAADDGEAQPDPDAGEAARAHARR